MTASGKWGVRFLLGVGAFVVGILAVVGGITLVRVCGKALRPTVPSGPSVAGTQEWIPASKRPGPPYPLTPERFTLTATNAQSMVGMDDPLNERWCDVAGNFYAAAFIAGYSHETGRGLRHPHVLVRVDPHGDTLKGRLEAHRLKPNFAYQLKLRGLFADRAAFEAIGRAGRWRLPGRGTNYTDADYETYPDKAAVESYILFDYFVTDRNGNAVRNFALDSSLHVLWNATRQGGEPEPGDLFRAVVLADDPATYARPKPGATAEWLWAERERPRYAHADQQIRLPPGTYEAELVLTEESFHSQDRDGGFWATVFRCPVAFAIER